MRKVNNQKNDTKIMLKDIKVFNNEHYDLSFDPDKNRMYFTMKGFCPSPDNVPSLANTWQSLCKSARPGFTILEDFSTMKTLSDEMYKLVVKIHLLLIRLSISKIAIVLPRKSEAYRQIIDVTKLAVLPFATFESFTQAEMWLNERTSANRRRKVKVLL